MTSGPDYRQQTLAKWPMGLEVNPHYGGHVIFKLYQNEWCVLRLCNRGFPSLQHIFLGHSKCLDRSDGVWLASRSTDSRSEDWRASGFDDSLLSLRSNSWVNSCPSLSVSSSTSDDLSDFASELRWSSRVS